MDDLGAVLYLGLHGPAEGNGMVLRHVGSHHDDTVGVRHTPGVEGCCAPAEACPQTGDARAVSYPCLVFNRHNAKPAQEFLAQVVELNLERRTA